MKKLCIREFVIGAERDVARQLVRGLTHVIWMFLAVSGWYDGTK